MNETAGTAYYQTNQTLRAALVAEKQSPDQVLEQAFGEPFVRYREKWRATERFELETPWPLHLDVDTNYTCNLRCIMCPLGQKGHDMGYAGRFLDFNLYEKVIREGVESGLRALRLGLTGEPLLRPDIIEFVSLARSLGVMDVMLITNGLLLDEERSRDLIESGLVRLHVSVDAATETTYQRIRRGGSLGTVTQNILNFLDLRNSMGLGLPLVRVSYVDMSLNAGERNAFYDFWKDKADYVSIQAYANILERGDTAFFTEERTLTPSFRCPDPWQRMSLFVNGDLFPCCSDFGRLAPMGSALDTPVARVWQSPAARRLRRLQREGRWREEPVCRRCALASTACENTK